jgi:hypothetical protein
MMEAPCEDKTCFKICPMCGRSWRTREDFLSDLSVKLLGYQVNFEALTLGLFLFNHMTCQDTIGIEVGEFADLHAGPVYHERKTGSDECPGYCLHHCELKPCPAKCECAWVREVMQKMRQWPGDKATGPA